MVWPDPPPGHMGVFHFFTQNPNVHRCNGAGRERLNVIIFFSNIYTRRAGWGWKPGGLNHTTIYGLI